MVLKIINNLRLHFLARTFYFLVHPAKAFVADGASHHRLAKPDSEALASVGRSSIIALTNSPG